MRSTSRMLPFFTKIVLLFCIACSKKEDSPKEAVIEYETVPLKHPVADGVIDEVSGIAPSYVNPGMLWTIEDSDRPTELGLLDASGAVEKKISVNGVTNRDWEDIATGIGPETGAHYIYIAEIGDNAKVYNVYAIYRMKEPAATADKVELVDKISFKYPDGNHDAEAILLDQATKDIYIISKTDAKSKLYKLVYPYATDVLHTVVFVSDLPYNLVTAANISGDGKEMLVRTYGSIYYFSLTTGKTIPEVLAGTFTQLQHEAEPQGESICFAADQKGFFTISEKLFSSPVSLNFYKKRQ